MPCYTVQQANVELLNADHKMLQKSLEKDGYKVERGLDGKIKSFSKGNIKGTYDGKKLNFTGTNKVDSDAIKRGYSGEVIEQKAKEYKMKGWDVYKQKGQWVFTKVRA